MEIWKDITGYEGYFQVSNLGNFRSLDRIIKYKNSGTRLYPGKPLLKETTLDGYQRIVLMKEAIKRRFMCHRLVAQEFIPNPENKPFINHINGDKSDNMVENLEWCTQSENELHSFRTLGNTMANKTYPKRIKCIETDTIFPSMLQTIKWIGNNACIEGLKKAINVGRKYHDYTFIYI